MWNICTRLWQGMWQALSRAVLFHPCESVVQAEPYGSFSVCVCTREGKKESELDSSCLILGSEWTLGFQECFNQGGSHHSYWRKQLDPSPSFLPIQPPALWQCKCDEWVCLTSSPLWFHTCRHSLFCQHKAWGSTGVRMDSWGKGIESCKYCQLKAQRLLLSFLYSQQTTSCPVSSTLFFN